MQPQPTFTPLAPSEHTLLILDDEESILLSLEMLFRREGYKVLTATRPEQALALMARNSVSLVIADERLPGVRGTEVLKQIQIHWPDTFRVTLTGYADVQAVIKAINDGHVFRYLTKPWDEDEIRAVVRDGLRRYDLARENRRLYALTVQQAAELRAANESLEQKVAERTAEVEAKHRALEETLLEVVGTLNGLLEARGIGHKGHAARVSEASGQVAERLGLSREDRLEIEMAATLHDIGKVSLPDELARKDPLTLSRAEAALFREHPVLGQSLLSGIRRLEGAGRIIRGQGEWYNGTGYPDRLSGEAIPVGSRLIAVVDTWEERRERSILEQGSGRRFDPNVAAAFLSYLDEHTAAAHSDRIRPLDAEELLEGMILKSDVYTGRGLLLATRGKMVDKSTLEKIIQFHRVDPIVGKVYVQG